MKLVWFVLTKNGFVIGQQRQTGWHQTRVLVLRKESGERARKGDGGGTRAVSFSIKIMVLE